MYSFVNISMDSQSRRVVLVTSIVLLLLGVIGICLPQVLSIATAVFAGWLLLIAGIAACYICWHSDRERWAGWLRPFALILFGLLLLLHPLAGTAALGLVLAVYFLLDGFAGVGSAWEMRPRKGWAWFMLNGVLSLVLAAVFIAGWPFTSAWLVGFFIGISLFFQGGALMTFALAAKTE